METVLRTTLIYLVLVLLIRMMGKRGLAEMSTFDIVVTFLLAEIVGGAAIGAEDSVTGGIVGAVTLVGSTPWCITWCSTRQWPRGSSKINRRDGGRFVVAVLLGSADDVERCREPTRVVQVGDGREQEPSGKIAGGTEQHETVDHAR